MAGLSLNIIILAPFFREPIRCRKLFQTIYTSEKFGDADDARAQLDSN